MADLHDAFGNLPHKEGAAVKMVGRCVYDIRLVQSRFQRLRIKNDTFFLFPRRLGGAGIEQESIILNFAGPVSIHKIEKTFTYGYKK